MTGERGDGSTGRCDGVTPPVFDAPEGQSRPVPVASAFEERPAGAAGTPVWSPEPMIERLGGDEELARQLVTLFIAEYPKLLDALRDSTSAADADRIRRAAHALKGCVGNFVDDGARQTAFEIECMGAEGRLSGIAGLVVQLERELAGLAGAMLDFESRACGS